jgi:hypothetical protein
MGSKLDRAVRQSESTGADFLKLHKWESGDTDIRLLPAAKGDDEDDWFIPIGLHYNMGEKFPILCPYVTEWAGVDCPVCKLVEEFRQNNMNDEANKFSVRKPFYARAIVRGQESEGVQVVRLPSTLFRAITTLVQDTEAYGDVLSPGPKGRDIRIHKTGTNLDTKYQANVLPNQKPALPSKKLVMDLLADLPPISHIIQVPDASEMDSIMTAKFGASAIGVSVEETDEWEETPEESLETEESLESGKVILEDTDTILMDDTDWSGPGEAPELSVVPVVPSENPEPEDDDWLDEEGEKEDEEEIVSARDVVEAARAEHKKSLEDDLLDALPTAKKGTKAKAKTKSRRKKKE